MTLFPVVGRELRVASRRAGTYWNRFVTGLMAIIVAGWMLIVMEAAGSKAEGQQLFIALAVIAFLYGLVAGVGHTSDCVSEEKREGTLGLLFLTDLRGFEVVFGKLVATYASFLQSLGAHSSDGCADDYGWRCGL